MIERAKDELLREAFVEGAKWARNVEERHLLPTVRGVTANAEAARRYPEIDVQQGPSGAWYRLTNRCGNLVIRRWETQNGATKDLPINWMNGVEPGDELAVAELLQRHAERGA